MKAGNCHRYRLRLRNREIVSVEKDGHKVETFSYPVTASDLPKIYVVKSGPEVIYVGHTKQSIRSRLKYGLEAQGKGGYHGYMWKDLPKVDILIWCFPDRDKEYAEAIEGELVFLFRSRTGKWPKHQIEIHFHRATVDTIRMAEAIYAEACR